MTDGLSTLYRDLLGGSYDCVDRIVLNAYFRMGHDPGGFRVWWRALTGSDETLENAYLMVWGGGAVPNNDDIWMVVEYLGSSSAPLASFANTTKSNNLATGSAVSTDSSSWGGSTTAFKMSVTITPQLAGYLRVYVMAAKVSSTFYIDPLPVLS
jgi:hypothetical protein